VLQFRHVRPVRFRPPQRKEISIMTRGLIVLVAAATMAAAVAPAQAGGRGGAVAAGIIGGLAAGAIIGSAAAGPRYYEPAPVYVAPPPPSCYWTRGEPVWDPYRGVWRRPRMQVCD
jgi:hypothetical protein